MLARHTAVRVLAGLALLPAPALAACGGSTSSARTPGAQKIERLRREQEASEQSIESEQQERAAALERQREENRAEAERQTERGGGG